MDTSTLNLEPSLQNLYQQLNILSDYVKLLKEKKVVHGTMKSFCFSVQLKKHPSDNVN